MLGIWLLARKTWSQRASRKSRRLGAVPSREEGFALQQFVPTAWKDGQEICHLFKT